MTSILASSRSLTQFGGDITAKRLGKKRIWEVDYVRGLFFLGVLAFHLCFILTMLPQIFSNFGEVASPAGKGLVNWCYYFLTADYTKWLIRVFSGAFLLLTGVSCALSHNNLLRGFKIFAFALLITFATIVGTTLLDTDIVILFGILHCIGFSIIVCGLLEPLTKKMPLAVRPWLYLSLGLALVAVGYWLILTQGVETNVVFFSRLTFTDFLKVVAGLAVMPGDTFGLLPHAGLVFIGVAVGQWLYGRKKVSRLPKLDGKWSAPIRFVGRHSLWIYVLHQPLYLASILAIMLPLGFKLAL